jgi:hypothetical protein
MPERIVAGTDVRLNHPDGGKAGGPDWGMPRSV